MIGKANADLR